MKETEYLRKELIEIQKRLSRLEGIILAEFPCSKRVILELDREIESKKNKSDN